MFAMLLLADDVGDAIARYGALTRAEADCSARTGDAEVTVCATRLGARYRIPPPPERGDRLSDDVAAERARLVQASTSCETQIGTPIGCGSAGIGVTVEFGAGPKRPPRLGPPPGSDR